MRWQTQTPYSRRKFLATAGAAVAGAALSGAEHEAIGQIPGERPPREGGVEVMLPRGRVPVSLIIDDSTCLVNLNRFAIPQFAEAWGGKRYFQDWRKMPVEIPDDFVRRFGNWAGENGVKGKYSIVPYPACVGRVDRLLPGWTRDELAASLDLVRNLILPNWDIHPEMVTHTIAIDTKTGLPLTERSPRVMENWDWTKGRSVDEMTEYLAYALRILREAGLPCEGVTTPGGFGNQVLPELSQATLQSCRDVYRAEIPHYFRHMYTSGDRSVAPRVEYAANLDSDDPQCVVSIIGCAGDWTGGWDCSDRGNTDRFISPDLKTGRMVDVIERGEPAIIVCHWTGIYFNGEEVGFRILRDVASRLAQRYDNVVWMKLSEIARYWAARELTRVEPRPDGIALRAPYACPAFTVRVQDRSRTVPRIISGSKTQELRAVGRLSDLVSGTCLREKDTVVVCFELPKGDSRLVVGG
jgi:hypothetical protein